MLDDGLVVCEVALERSMVVFEVVVEPSLTKMKASERVSGYVTFGLTIIYQMLLDSTMSWTDQVQWMMA